MKAKFQMSDLKLLSFNETIVASGLAKHTMMTRHISWAHTNR